MSIMALRVAAIGCVLGVSACAANPDNYQRSGIAQSAPVGTHLKNKDGYRRGGRSSSVKVIGRSQISQRQGATADEILRSN